MDALDIQIGGSHYKKTPYQPVTLTADLGLNFIQGNIIKYATRYKFKNGREDLEKVVHYAQLGQDLNPENFYLFFQGREDLIDIYCSKNNLTDIVSTIIRDTVYQDWISIIANTGKLIEQEYGTVH